jgi:hypothetical protein
MKRCTNAHGLAITKNGITKLGGPPVLDVSKFKTDNKITDDEILKILEQPLSRVVARKDKKKKKKKKRKTTKAHADEDEDEDEDDSSDDE